jgi:hypothetical protein
MSNIYTYHTAVRSVPCTESEFHHLRTLLFANQDDGVSNDHGFDIEHNGDGVYLFADESGTADDLPVSFLKGLGASIATAGLPYLEVGFACTDSKRRADSQDGGRYRIMLDGSLKYPTLAWD